VIEMVKVKVVDSKRALGFGQRGIVSQKGKLMKYSRDKSGRVWKGWRKGTKF